MRYKAALRVRDMKTRVAAIASVRSLIGHVVAKSAGSNLPDCSPVDAFWALEQL